MRDTLSLQWLDKVFVRSLPMHNCLSLDFQNMQKQPFLGISTLILRRSFAMKTNRRQVYQVIPKGRMCFICWSFFLLHIEFLIKRTFNKLNTFPTINHCLWDNKSFEKLKFACNVHLEMQRNESLIQYDWWQSEMMSQTLCHVLLYQLMFIEDNANQW